MEFLGYHITIGICILLSAFFSGTETSIISASRLNLEYLARLGNPGARRGLLILDNIEDAVSMVLIGNNIVNMSAASFLVYIATRSYLLSDLWLFLLTIVQTIFFLIFCELSPKIITNAMADSYLMFFSLPIRVLMFVLKPAVNLSLLVTSAYKRFLGLNDIKRSLITSRDEIDILFDMGEKEGIITYDHKTYVSEMLTFKDMCARDIMRPTISIVSIDIKAGVRSLVDMIDKTGFSRIPVFENRVDNITGYIFYRDILKRPDEKNLSDYLIRAHYIPSTKNIFELYLEMIQNKVPLVFVVNEHGGVIGMVTHEDIAEEVVGEIQTADHNDEDYIRPLDDGRFVLRGDMNIDFFNRSFHLDIEKKGFETIAGFLMFNLKRIPRKGDTCEYKKYRFQVDEGSERSVTRILLIPPKKLRKK